MFNENAMRLLTDDSFNSYINSICHSKLLACKVLKSIFNIHLASAKEIIDEVCSGIPLKEAFKNAGYYERNFLFFLPDGSTEYRYVCPTDDKAPIDVEGSKGSFWVGTSFLKDFLLEKDVIKIPELNRYLICSNFPVFKEHKI